MPTNLGTVLITNVVLLVLAAAAAYLALRLARRNADNTIVMGLFLLATIFAVVAIFTVTFLGKTRG